eukprot:6184345-Pleurochrysis_carterae.AAC.2
MREGIAHARLIKVLRGARRIRVALARPHTWPSPPSCTAPSATRARDCVDASSTESSACWKMRLSCESARNGTLECRWNGCPRHGGCEKETI